MAYLAQHLVVLLDPSDIVANLHNAYRRPELRDGHYTVFHSGLRRRRILKVCSFSAHKACVRFRSCLSRGPESGPPNERAREPRRHDGAATTSIVPEVNQPIAGAVTNANAALRWLSARPPDLDEAGRALDRILENRAGEVIARSGR